jgi:predicted Zn-dependent peptidase
VSESWDNPVISVGVGIKVGSRDETKETSGTAHFLEHLNFKGTQRKTRLQLEKSIESIGAHLNAFTSREFTLYHMLTTQRNLEFAMDMLGDILLNSNYHKYDLENERNTIISELESVGKDDFEVLMENVNFGVYMMK